MTPDTPMEAEERERQIRQRQRFRTERKAKLNDEGYLLAQLDAARQERDLERGRGRGVVTSVPVGARQSDAVVRERCIHRSHWLRLPCFRFATYDYYCAHHNARCWHLHGVRHA